MNRLGKAMFGLLITTSIAAAQNSPTVEQLQQSYDEAMVQLKAAQDRKNELALENQKLTRRIAELEQQSADVKLKLEVLENRAYFLREHYAAWHDFLRLNPPIAAMWSTFFNSIGNNHSLTDIFGDGNWPFSIEE